MSERKEKFTPGPWEADGTTIYADAFKAQRNIHGAVACLVVGEDDLAHQEHSNAHLIAAAPELYDIAKRIYELLIHPTAPVTAFEAWELCDVLKKCRGEKVDRPFKAKQATGGEA